MELSLGKLTWKAQLGVVAVLSAALAGVFHQYWVVPRQEEMQQQQRRITQLSVGINKGLVTARQLPEFRQQVADLEARLESLRAVLPEQKDVGDLLRRLQALATEANLQIKSFKPSPIVTRQMHAEWPIALELEGTYHNLGRFFDQVAKFSRIITINQIQVRGKDQPAPETTITASCVATTFVLLERTGPPAPAGSAQTE
jgi:type IV pilus assembly protein PilO